MEKLKKARENLLVTLVLSVFCAAMLLWGIPTYIKVPATAQGQGFTPQTMPYLLMGTMALCLVAEWVNGIRAYLAAKKELATSGETPQKEKKTKHEIITGLMPYIMFALVVICGVLINKVGFLITFAIMIPVILLIIGCRKWHYYVIVYAFAGIMWAVFRLLLKVQLP